MTLLEEAPKGRLQGLIALRDRLAQEIDVATQSAAVAALSRQFSDVLMQIDELDVAPAADAPVSPLDEMRRRRAERARKTG